MAPRRTPGLRPLRKSWQKGLASLPGLDGKRRRQDDRLVIPDIPAGKNVQFEGVDDRLSELARVLNDEPLAKRVLKLQDEQFPNGTLLELVIHEYLTKKRRDFVYQLQLFGGHRAGGVVPDFAVSFGGGWLVIAANGWFFHQKFGSQDDEADKLRMLGTSYQGKIIEKVVRVWDTHVMVSDPQRSRVLDDALTGIEWPEP